MITHGRLVSLLASAVLLNMSDSIASPSMSIESSHQRGMQEDDDRTSISQVSGAESIAFPAFVDAQYFGLWRRSDHPASGNAPCQRSSQCWHLQPAASVLSI